MAKTVFLFDGFNLYHTLVDKSHLKYKWYQYKWLDLAKLARCFITSKDTIEEIYYFTALASWSADKMRRHRTYIKALQSRGVRIVYGAFKRKDRHCSRCNKYYRTFEEKQTDVNIAIYLFQLAIQDKYDKAFIVSADSDLIPAIEAVQRNFPTKSIGIVLPIGRASESLKNVADFHMKMKDDHLKTCLFDHTIVLPDGQTIQCPAEWTNP